MKRVLLLMSVLLSLGHLASARLGWTLEECKKFYVPQDEGTAQDGTKWYSFGKENTDFTIIVVFGLNGRAVYVRYELNDGQISLRDVDSLLDKNTVGCTWDFTPRQFTDGVEHWIGWEAYSHGRPTLNAQLDTKRRSLTICYESERHRESETDKVPNL